MPRTKEQNEAIRAEKRQMIMEAALQLFAENGYAHTSIDRIAVKAGISKGLIYTYFESKDDLLRQIYLSGIRKIAEAELFQGEITSDILVHSMDKMLDMIVEYRDFFRLYTALCTQPGISQKIGQLVNTSKEVNMLLQYFKTCYGEKAVNETLLLSSITKGYSILTLFSDGQSVIPVGLLKPAVMAFIRERWGNKPQQAVQNEKHEQEDQVYINNIIHKENENGLSDFNLRRAGRRVCRQSPGAGAECEGNSQKGR